MPFHKSSFTSQSSVYLNLKPFPKSSFLPSLNKETLDFPAEKKMSSSSTRNNNQEHQVEARRRWVPSFCRKTFFGNCSHHPDRAENQLNWYCINCDASLCKHCKTPDSNSHEGHNLLKIYRHVYQDAVVVQDMEPHIDCTQIQAYKSNGKLVIVLQPLPHRGAGEAHRERACRACLRILMPDQERYRFCSISCQVKAYRRKGTPHRSPLR